MILVEKLSEWLRHVFSSDIKYQYFKVPKENIDGEKLNAYKDTFKKIETSIGCAIEYHRNFAFALVNLDEYKGVNIDKIRNIMLANKYKVYLIKYNSKRWMVCISWNPRRFNAIHEVIEAS